MQELHLQDIDAKKDSWSPETFQCLVSLNLWLSAQADCLEAIGVAGGKELGNAYRELARRVGEFNNKGPAALDFAVDKACAKADALQKIRTGRF